MIYVMIPALFFASTMVWAAFVPPLMAWPVAYAARKLLGEPEDKYDSRSRREAVGITAVAMAVFLWLLCVLAPVISLAKMLEGC